MSGGFLSATLNERFVVVMAGGGLALVQLTNGRSLLVVLLVLGVLAGAVTLRGGLPETISLMVLSIAWAAWRFALPEYQYWPFIMLAPLAVVATARLAVAQHCALYWRAGCAGGRVGPAAFGVAAASCAALWLWLDLMAPDLSLQRSVLPDANPAMKVAAVAGFALANAVLEEVIYRGVVQAAFAAAFRHPAVSVVAQAAIFAAAHAQGGVPDGTVGVCLTFVYGTMLGLLRHRAQGLAIPIAVHVTTDAFIGAVLFFGRS
jgi:membrane protease YdiL (CAAX protease family)